MFWRSALLVGVYSAVFTPTVWLFVLPFVILANPSAEKWIWESVPKEGRRRLRRLWAEQARVAQKATAAAEPATESDSEE
jgi:hypothetical protein